MNSKGIFMVVFAIIFTLFGNVQRIDAQLLKKIKKRTQRAAEEAVIRKTEQKVYKETSKKMDTILGNGVPSQKGNSNQMDKSSNSTSNNAPQHKVQNTDDSTLIVKSKIDFVAGNKVIYTDTFKNDAIGDFPVTWNTNSSGEVVTFNDNNIRWLQLSLGQYTLDDITEIPKNSTFEFDLTVTDNFNYYSDGFWVNIVAVKDRRKDFTKWSRFGTGSNGVRLRLKPKNFYYVGETAIKTYIDNSLIIDNKKNTKQFTLKNKIVHVALWRQKNRLRVYLNEEKIWDLPRAFGPANYNSITFNTSGKDGEYFFVSNLRLAIAGKDTRHPLLETGRFVTDKILFDVNKSDIKPSSFKILDDLGKVLQDNPTVTIKIIGHTDSDGDATSNQLLSEKRAQAIKDYLSNNFPIAGKRMIIIGKGESESVANNSTPEGKAKNRRVEFIKL